ncbi:arylamine N-acetyltransferase family protein [Streptomyces orinoci]|uniref:Arylamine N-acetyltransferase n=1 Tax=Streptomyces orinoci TaxID=67339 RepID=A0ABV3K2F4_STRON|nr:arylamine N-acetyltransferase [Streptomyces orinoci]
MSEFPFSGDKLDLDAYLGRIGLGRAGGPDPGTLRMIHRAHLAAFPFENLEILLGRPVLLDIKALQEKLVDRRRGGYCFEHNLLLAAVLERLGFAVWGLAARVSRDDGGVAPVTHMALGVHAGGQDWLCDVGFGGDGLLDPLPLRPAGPVPQDGRSFAVETRRHGVRVLRTLRPEGWSDLYAIGPERRLPVDYAVMNHYTSTHAGSPFVSRLLVQRTEEGVRRSLVGRALKVTRSDGSREQRDVGGGELREVLRSQFLIELDDADAETLVRVCSVVT